MAFYQSLWPILPKTWLITQDRLCCFIKVFVKILAVYRVSFFVIMEPFCFHSLINWFNTLKVCFINSVYDSLQLTNKTLSLTSKTFKFEDILFPEWIRKGLFLISLWPYILIMLALRLRWYWYMCCTWYGQKKV